MELKISMWYFLTLSLLIKVIYGAGSCPNGKSGYSFNIKVNKKPAAVDIHDIAEDSYYRETCASEKCCYKHCKAHYQHCSVALYHRGNRTCDLVCLMEEGSYVVTINFVIK